MVLPAWLEAGLPRLSGHVTASDVEAELRRIGHELKPLAIVVINTRAGTRYGQDDYVNSAAAWVAKPRCTCWSAT